MSPFFGSGGKRFSTWQIEITTRCPLLCKMCIKSVFKDYERKDMSIEDFKRLSPYFRLVGSVVLEGWGESLLHPQLLNFIRIVKEEGSLAGFVTSGYGLTEDYIKELLKVGVDFLGFSFSGAKASTHQAIRVNSDFEKMVWSIRYFRELSKSLNIRCPKIHIVYLLLKENVEESPMIIDLAKSLGIKEVVFLNIIQISSKEQDEMKVFVYEGESPYEDILLESKRKASSYGIKLFMPSLISREVSTCPENPLRSLYISVNGDVSPCVYLNPPVESQFVRIFKGEANKMEKVVFGNLFCESLNAVWSREQFRVFREAHKEREEAKKRLFESLMNFKLSSECRLPPLPLVCQNCHKIYGL